MFEEEECWGVGLSICNSRNAATDITSSDDDDDGVLDGWMGSLIDSEGRKCTHGTSVCVARRRFLFLYPLLTYIRSGITRHWPRFCCSLRRCVLIDCVVLTFIRSFIYYQHIRHVHTSFHSCVESEGRWVADGKWVNALYSIN